MAELIIKLLIIQNKITHYNLPIYNLLADKTNIDLSIAHFGSKLNKVNTNFKTIDLNSYNIGPFIFSKQNIFKLSQNFEVVITMADLHWVPLLMLSKKINRNFKLIYWTIGVSASYSNKFDTKTRFDFLRFFFLRSSDAILFYSAYPINKYIKNKFPKEMLFVAPNTIPVNNEINIKTDPFLKDSILFIGTLYKEKGIMELLNSYRKAFNQNTDIPNLNIIGDGIEMSNINKWLNKYELKNKVFLLGAIYNDNILADYFKNSIACISPCQSGLSVLSSMGYGVPFITKFDSITGGERLNIKDNETGILYKNHSDLFDIILDISRNKIKYINMGIKAKKFYLEHRTPKHMVNGFINSINYVTNKINLQCQD